MHPMLASHEADGDGLIHDDNLFEDFIDCAYGQVARTGKGAKGKAARAPAVKAT